MSKPKSRYPRADFPLFKGHTVLSTSSLAKCVDVPAEHVGACILVHGVNDVGNSYQAVEEGLLEGLAQRMGWQPDQSKNCQPPYNAAEYRMPGLEDSKKLEADPDAVFFKRSVKPKTYSPVIPFYWGYRDMKSDRNRSINGQLVDDFGNRLDLDRSKGGGPFANATTNLADMWNRGAPAINEYVDMASRDPYRPLRGGPGRMYFVLAAQRLAALVAMIRDYNQDVPETVTIIAHSQGCLVSLLAQAFLMEEGKKAADTLILTHPPYALEPHFLEKYNRETDSKDKEKDKNPAKNSDKQKGKAPKKDTEPVIPGGEDSAMQGLYEALEGLQNVRARLDTLVNVVRGVAAKRKPTWSRDELTHMERGGLHTKAWKVTEDRDNRGKVYLYFCPEDMTVALPNVQGIGWQGVPYDLKDDVSGTLLQPLKKLGQSFLQRVFTGKPRMVGGKLEAFKVGLPPQDFILRPKGEDDRAHADGDVTTFRAHLPEYDSSREKSTDPEDILALRAARRLINGEELKPPHTADLHGGGHLATKQSKRESVDPIDAAIAVTSNYGLRAKPQEVIDDPRPGSKGFFENIATKMFRAWLYKDELADVNAWFNKGKADEDKSIVTEAMYLGDQRLRITRLETPREARLRHQRETSARSFHGAIWGSKANHAKVTAYDVAVGLGQAVTDPGFYRYLCAVADWRVKKPAAGMPDRDGILTWKKFTQAHDKYFSKEPDERKELIEESSTYYSTGVLPKSVKSIAERPKAIIAETTDGRSPPIKTTGKPT